MGKIALYRKYRSRALDEVVGQDHVTGVLAAAAKSGNFSHAYLLTGPRGIGKTSVARIIAHLANDLPYNDENHIDIIEIDAASNTGVDNIRDLRDKANIAPTAAKYKVYIIDEVHMLSGGAFNALLKTLEEPPAHVIFILATTEVQKLPATILSRTQRFHFRPVDETKVAAHLRQIADQEKVDIDDEALLLIARRGGGSFRDSISLLDQLSGLMHKITKNDVEDILGLAPEEKIAELAEAVAGRKSKTVIATLKNFRDEGVTASVIVDQLTARLADIADGRARIYEIIEKLIDVPKSANPDIKLLATLMVASSGGESVATQATPSATVVIEEKTTKKVAKTPPKATPQTTPKPAEATADLVGSGKIADLDWDKVVAEAKNLNGACGGLIGGASIDFEDGILTLYYDHKIHRAKMADNKYRKVLGDALMKVYDTVPKIVIADGPKPKSEVAMRVADIMGAI